MSDAVAARVLLGDRERASLRCPLHGDRRPSLRVARADDGTVLLRCWAGCPTEDVVTALGFAWSDLYPSGWSPSRQPRRLRLSELPVPVDPATELPEPSSSRWVTRLADKRRWSIDLLDRLGCRAVVYRRRVVRVRFPFVRAGRTVYWHDRLVLDGEPRWLFPSGTCPCPWGADNITRARERGHAYLTEGTSDAVALLHAFPEAAVFGIPGAGAFKRQWAPAFAGLVVWVFADADDAGRRLRQVVATELDDRAEVRQVAVRQPWKDLDDWRRGTGDDFNDQLADALVKATERRTW
jgi:hypothetical protein